MSDMQLTEQEQRELSGMKWLVAIEGEPYHIDEFDTKAEAERYKSICEATDKICGYKTKYKIRLRSEN